MATRTHRRVIGPHLILVFIVLALSFVPALAESPPEDLAVAERGVSSYSTCFFPPTAPPGPCDPEEYLSSVPTPEDTPDYDGFQTSLAFASLAACQASRGNTHEAMRSISTALSAANRFEEDGPGLYGEYAALPFSDVRRDLAEIAMLVDHAMRDLVFGSISLSQVKMADFEDAVATARRIEDDHYQHEILGFIAKCQAMADVPGANSPSLDRTDPLDRKIGP